MTTKERPTTPYRVKCPHHGTQPITEAAYQFQSNQVLEPWRCPLCGKQAEFDSKNLEAFQTKDDEEYGMGASEQPMLHVFQRDGEWECWLNPDVPLTGLCIGAGDSRQEAVADAVASLEWALETLQSTPPPEVKS